MMNVSKMIGEELGKRSDDKDEVDQANADIEQSMRLQLKNRETFALKRIDDALKRLDEGTYGLCESCEEFIEIRRLQARPTTTLCISTCSVLLFFNQRLFRNIRCNFSIGIAYSPSGSCCNWFVLS